MALPRAVQYKILRARHPSYDPVYWGQLRALAKGGKRLLRDPAMMAALFPQHAHEHPHVYAERCARAFYINYAGEIIGSFAAMMAEDPLTVTAEPKLDGFYDTKGPTEGALPFFEDVDGHGTTLTGFAQHQLRDALIARTAWALVDLPPRDATMGDAVASLADEERAGLLRAVALHVHADSVVDWECRPDGSLVWVCLKTETRDRPDPGALRGLEVEHFTFYDAEEWVRFDVAEDPANPVKDEDIIRAAAEGRHSFGRVPFAKFELPEELWLMDQLFSAARSHFQQRSALSWGQFKQLFARLVAYLGPEASNAPGTVPSEAQQDPGRAVNQVVGMGYTQVLGAQDKLEYVAPPASVFAVASQDLKDIRDEMHRVLSVMSLAVDNQPSNVGRSGASKEMDELSKNVIAKAIGVLLRKHIRDILALVRDGRRDPPYRFAVRGFEVFSSGDAQQAIADAVQVMNPAVDIPSPTFWTRYLVDLAQSILRHSATPVELAKIESEIQKNNTRGKPPVPGDAPPGLPGGPPGAPNGPPRLPGSPTSPMPPRGPVAPPGSKGQTPP